MVSVGINRPRAPGCEAASIHNTRVLSAFRGAQHLEGRAAVCGHCSLGVRRQGETQMQRVPAAQWRAPPHPVATPGGETWLCRAPADTLSVTVAFPEPGLPSSMAETLGE